MDDILITQEMAADKLISLMAEGNFFSALIMDVKASSGNEEAKAILQIVESKLEQDPTLLDFTL